jgi:hypothetical protein
MSSTLDHEVGCPDIEVFYDFPQLFHANSIQIIKYFTHSGPPPPSPEDGTRSNFRKVVFLLPGTPDDGKIPKT